MDKLKLVLKNSDSHRTIVRVGDIEFGRDLVLIAGPCSIESEEQAVTTAIAVKMGGADVFRGGVYKPRTSPYSFQGLGKDGLKILRTAGDEACLPVVTEVLDVRDMELVCRYADIIQIGARNMQNFPLLKEAGKCGKPVLLKRSMYANIQEFLNCAEYILSGGNSNVLLCERGIRTIENYTRNTLDLSAVPLLKGMTHLPVVVDPSHGTGCAALIPAMSKAAVASGADSIFIEVHCNPERALSDSNQQITTEQFAILAEKLRKTRAFFDTLC